MPDRFSPAAMLDAYRGNANDYMREQVVAFKSLSPTDQREFLFYMMANMAIAQSAIVDTIPSFEAEK
jgi:hypothetical protein